MTAETTKPSVHNLESLLNSLCDSTHGETVTIRDLLDAVGRRAYGPILLLLGFISVSPLTLIPGSTWLIALVTLLIAMQIVVGKKFPWVPRRFLDFEFKRKYLIEGIDIGRKYAHMIDRYLKPRLTILTAPLFAQLIALVCVAAALITIPLGLFPFGPVLPGLTIFFFGLGLTARDGVFLMLAGAAFAGAVAILIRVLPRVIAMVDQFFS
ncbi:exopolysaccharide biosynthesis protein [Henriciella aquimarina]|uniref:exopolysaccharide biosynthesis protein n=1 Tax=Henriciella aquimarina TaxID=545261 RepID=UPI0009FC91F7|nr:exopolysaccharide biosynthesis protein [Henriciella aquimarina]